MSNASSSSKRQKSSVDGEGDAKSLKVLVFDATEPGEPGMYVVDVEADCKHQASIVDVQANAQIQVMHARQLARRLRRNMRRTGQDVYEHVAVGGEDAGLISENSEDPENDLEEIITYLQTTTRVGFRPSLHCREGAIQVTISLASV
tara:strand:- start:2160 stop:2600 length:441 start_codon:yes stop_codon:yes gene_type:complete